ncbi:hypothetical protein A2619_05750 [candidate division WWE3 bacterium RIFOXYD1_FULL_39_9]|uniref:Uncharacterized protein n=1 Tax=candidate division WWE3 bacterium RIFOXYD1_FULL_39_9 TaxID=1802649 RepID=A0A1F4X408_UNCKA|nr:MAG: hypothetical protein A2619_05750 [candidate division WWE3 bacterium RIFOXYD1_FULL_39_9]
MLKVAVLDKNNIVTNIGIINSINERPNNAVVIQDRQACNIGWRYNGSSFSSVNSQSEIPIGKRRENAWKRLEFNMHSYIFVACDFPQPTQITLQAIFVDPDSNNQQRAACKSIFDWIKNTVLLYYYTKKIEIMTSENPESVTWNFPANCNSSAPKITLAQILRMGM